MPINFTDAEISTWVGVHLWPLFRIASFFMAIPIIGTQLIPMRIRLGLALLTAMVVVPNAGPVPQIDALSLSSLYVIFQQVLIGVSLAFVLTMLVQLFVVAGQIIAMQMGLGFAQMVDPTNGVSVPVLSQFYLISVTLLFLAINGHLVMIEVIVNSFQAWPISTSMFSSEVLLSILGRISWMFAGALLMALPISMSVLIVNISFGVMTRAAPQMNVFSLGFPIGLIFGLFVVWVMYGEFFPNFVALTEQTFMFLNELQGF